MNADGRPITYKGQACLNLQSGQVELNKMVIIADIEDEVLLGSDILLKDEQGPADLIMSQSQMIFRGASVPMRCVGVQPQVRQVHAADYYEVPGLCEMVIDAYISNIDDGIGGDNKEGILIIERNSKATDDSSFLVASCLVDAT